MAKKVAFRQIDLTRAVRGASAGGMEVGQAEIDPASGRIVLIAKGQVAASGNDIDKWMAKREGRA